MLSPNDERQLSEAVKSAAGPVRIYGGGTRPVGNPVTGETLSVAGITGISLYEPGALTIVAAAGTPVAEIEAALAAENQRLPFEPMDHRKILRTEGEPTIGGVVAANVSGPRRIQVGACRDSLIGVRFVDGQGTIVKNGGRVMKNVTGYDLVKLLAGSFGTLGVLSEVAFKVLPSTHETGVLLINGLSVAQAVEAMSRSLRSPFEVSGAAHVASGIDGHPVTMIRVEGFETQVTHRTTELRALLGEFGDISVERDPDKTAKGWAWVRDAEKFAETPGDLWRISVKPSDAVSVAEKLGEDDLLLDWGGGLVWAEVPSGMNAREKLDGLPGHATLIRSDPDTRARLGAFHPEPAPVAALASGLRQKFDPRGILNPGLMA